jgi:hypothetical protein
MLISSFHRILSHARSPDGDIVILNMLISVCEKDEFSLHDVLQSPILNWPPACLIPVKIVSDFLSTIRAGVSPYLPEEPQQ